ncbi:RNA-binding KH domain-containing protein PEPPER isoform X2 [Impatiens glandulifera]|nr:RNA-binding KH domain-containing protein PEPPER isoform X2 [Impatiens glandulifera]
MPSEENGSLQQPSDVAIAAQVTTDSITSASNSDSNSNSENDVPTGNTSLEAPVQAPAPVAKWPGWPGHCVFRLIVPVLKAGMIIGRKGELIKKMCEETRARVRVLDGPNSCPDRIVLIHALEEPDALLSPAMDAALRVFKRVNGFLEVGVDNNVSGTAGSAFTSIRLLVPSTQAINLIGKQGAVIKAIQEKSGASVRVLSNDEVLNYVTSEERIVELQGEQVKVLKALEAVIGHLRKFLVDPSVIPLFQISHTNTAPQEQPSENWQDKISLQPAPQTRLGIEYSSLPIKRDSLYLDRDPFESHTLPTSVASRYSMDLGLSGLRSTGPGRAGGPIISQVTQTMQIPLAYAEDIIGIQGANIAYIRRSSGAILTVQESRGLPDEITVEVKGSTTQVQAAQQLIQEFIGGHKEPKSSGYSNMDSTGYRSSYTQLSTAYPPPSSTSMPPPLSQQQQQQHQQSYGGGYVPSSSSSSSLGGLGLGSSNIGGLGLGSSSLGGYSSYRL